MSKTGKQYRFMYCEIQNEAVFTDDGRLISDIGIDIRSEPVDSLYDRVCCKCGESLSADGKCDHCVR